MNVPPQPTCVAIAALLWLALAPAYPAQGQELVGRGKNLGVAPGREQFPPDHPVIRFDLPSGWVLDRGNDDKSMLICNLRGRADIGLLCMSLPQIFSVEELAKILPGIAHDQLDQQMLTDIEVVGQGTDTANGLPYYFVITKGKLKNRAMSVSFVGIMAQGRAYLVEYALPSADGPAHVRDFQTIVSSLAPVN